MSMPFSIFVDSSNCVVGACLAQPPEGPEQPVAFASSKLSTTQQNWATIEKEAYAALWALQKCRHWVFSKLVTIYSNHNPITFLTESTLKSAKLMRWSLALQEYDVTFRYLSGASHVAADCLSRNVNYGDDGS
jgi:RNase H-like domain found in reverse transcriptase